MLEINEALEQELANQKSLNLDSQGIMQKVVILSCTSRCNPK